MMRTKIAHEENEHPSASVAVLSCLKEVIGCTAPNLRVAGEVGVPLKYVPRWFRLHRRVSRTKQTSWVVLPKGTFVPYLYPQRHPQKKLALGVLCQEVVVIDSCSADGWKLVEAGVRPVPVVLVSPVWE